MWLRNSDNRMEKMTFQITARKYCTWCNGVINLCGFRGNGKEPDFCDRTHNRRMYNFKKIYNNTMQQLAIAKESMDTYDGFETETVKFFEYSETYLNLGLRADVLRVHLDAVSDGRKYCIVESVFRKKIEEGRSLR